MKTSTRTRPGGSRSGRIAWLAAILATLAGLGSVLYGYRIDATLFFHGGLLVAAAGLAVASLRAHRRGWAKAVLATNTVVCLFVSLVAVEGVWTWLEREPPGPAPYVYGGSLNAAQLRDRQQAMGQLFTRRQLPNLMPDPRRLNPYILRPGNHPLPDGTSVYINALGFRGPEIQRQKGPYYRVVAIGESTTYGATVGPGDTPWPAVLENLIESKLSCDRPVQVINAGVPGWNLVHQVRRLEGDILPLQPDLILAYHGYNGFHLILEQLPEALVEKAPVPPPRPSRVLERAETTLRLWWFRRRYSAARQLGESALETDPPATKLAALYRRLAYQSVTRGVKLALSTFNMAVNEDSPEDAIRFYEAAFPDVRARIFANRVNSRILRGIEHPPEIVIVDTSAGLDGSYQDAYRDLIHFNQLGRDRLAANILSELRSRLREDRKLNCRPRKRADTGVPDAG